MTRLLEGHRLELFLVLSLGFFSVTFFPRHGKTNNPNENVRVYMTKAIVDHGTYVIGHRVPGKKAGKFKDKGSVTEDWGYVNDRSLHCTDPDKRPPKCAGPLYSAKAPGTSLVGIPFYWAQRELYRAMGQVPSKEDVVYWLRLTTVLLPLIFFALHFFRLLKRRTDDEALAFFSTWVLAFATMVTTYAHMFASHLHVAFAFWAVVVLSERAFAEANDQRRVPLLYGAGLAAGLAVLLEYPSIAMLLPFGIALLVALPRRRQLVWVALGGLIPALLMAHYHDMCFGGPHITAQRWIEPKAFQAAIAPGFMGITGPSWRKIAGVLWSPYTGLLFFNPFWFMLAPAAWHALRDPILRRRLGLPLGIIGAQILFFVSHSLWRGGWTAGPRYLVAILPLALYVIAMVDARGGLSRRWLWRAGLLGLGAVALWNRTLVFLTTQGYPFEYYNPIYEFSLPMLRDGYVFQNPMNALGIYGLWSALPYALLVLSGFGLAAWRLLPRARDERRALILLTLALAVAFPVFQASFAKPPNAKRAKTTAWYRKVWLPIEQGAPGREYERLRAIPRAKRSRDEWARLATASTLLGKPVKLPAAMLRPPDEPLAPPDAEPAGRPTPDVVTPPDTHDAGPPPDAGEDAVDVQVDTGAGEHPGPTTL